MRLLFVTLCVLLLSSQIYADIADCDCGFVDENGRVWTDALYSDFTGRDPAPQQDRRYVVMGYTVPAKRANTIDRVFNPNNVVLTPQDSLKLTVKPNSQGRCTCASFGTRRQDILYGSFRVCQKTSCVPGTVGGFFFFRNNTCEIDMESLSHIQNPWKTYFTIHPQIYNSDGSASRLTNDKHVLSFNPTERFHEYRFDWLPNRVTYFLDGQVANQLTKNVPAAPGRVLVNHWTDGNPNFSKGPPQQDATLCVASLVMFYNTSEPSPLKCQKTQKPCRVTDILNHGPSRVPL